MKTAALDAKTVDCYRAVFNTPHGKHVLIHMLCDLGFVGETEPTPEGIALLNYAKRLLSILGGGKGKERKVGDVVLHTGTIGDQALSNFIGNLCSQSNNLINREKTNGRR